MIKRVVVIILLVLVGAYFMNRNSYLEKKAKEKAEKVEVAEAVRIEKITKAAVAQLVDRTNAVANWQKILLNGQKFRMDPIMTIELERLWLTGRPILFFGSIGDIATADQKNYRIEITGGVASILSFGTELRLSLKCPKQRIDSILTEHPDLLKFNVSTFTNEFAVIAGIDKIETKIISGAEGGSEDIKIGQGQCVDILYTAL